MPAMRAALVLTALGGLVLSGCGQGRTPARVATPSAATPTSSVPAGSAAPRDAASGSAAPSDGSTSTPAGAGRCTTDDLRVGAGEVRASASTRTLTIKLTNVSDDRCTVTGFGGLALLDASGARLPTNLQRADERPRTIELAPWGSTTREISWRVVPAQGADPVGDCVSGEELLVTPPDEEPGDLVVDEAITACEGGTITGTPWDREVG